MTDTERIDELERQVDALARALTAVINGGVGGAGAFVGSTGHLNGGAKAREHLATAGLVCTGQQDR